MNSGEERMESGELPKDTKVIIKQGVKTEGNHGSFTAF